MKLKFKIIECCLEALAQWRVSWVNIVINKHKREEGTMFGANDIN